MSRLPYAEKVELKNHWYLTHGEYQMIYWDNWDYGNLFKIENLTKRQGKDKYTVNDVIIMFDTETSKTEKNKIEKGKYIAVPNIIVAWTISIRAYHVNLVTLYGQKPSELPAAMQMIQEHLNGDKTYFFAHNLAYDWTFCRQFLMKRFGQPISQLNTKSHYPINIEFENGIILKDSLIISQRSLEKWAKDLDVVHQKSVGKWDYDLLRHQDTPMSADELEYIEHDTLAGAECLDATLLGLNRTLAHLPYTATGIPRDDVKKLGKSNKAHKEFLYQALTFEQYLNICKVYHGGYVHGNRDLIEFLIDDILTVCYDEASAYPAILTQEKMPMDKFMPSNADIYEIMRRKEDFAYYFELTILYPKLKKGQPMPYLQFSKCVNFQNPLLDNGRVIAADYVVIWLTEQDLEIILNQYTYKFIKTDKVMCARKDYLPRWFTDYVYERYKMKTMLKGGDPVLYALEKAKLNSLYGMSVQHVIQDEQIEDYITGEFRIEEKINKEEYEKAISSPSKVLPYQWGVWVTAYATNRLFKIGSCAGTWIYSDTDSVYGQNWNLDKLTKYNQEIKAKSLKNGYGPVIFNDREYWLGVCEKDGEYSEFKVLGSKRYCGRSVEDGELHITVAGVPKRGVASLKNDINNFKPGFIFDPETSHKVMHTYILSQGIKTTDYGDEIADSVDLNPCEYLLDSVFRDDWEEAMNGYPDNNGGYTYITEAENYDETVKRL